MSDDRDRTGTSGTGPSDLAERIAARAAEVDRAGVWWVLRAALCAIAVGYLLLAVPSLLFSDNLHHGHLAHHLGAFGLAYGVALLSVALRPATARAFVPFTVALAATMVVLAVIDVAQGQAPALAETQHLIELAGLVLVWLLATRRSWAAPGSTTTARPRHLRVVRHDEEGRDTPAADGPAGRHRARDRYRRPA